MGRKHKSCDSSTVWQTRKLGRGRCGAGPCNRVCLACPPSCDSVWRPESSCCSSSSSCDDNLSRLCHDTSATCCKRKCKKEDTCPKPSTCETKHKSCTTSSSSTECCEKKKKKCSSSSSSSTGCCETKKKKKKCCSSSSSSSTKCCQSDIHKNRKGKHHKKHHKNVYAGCGVQPYTGPYAQPCGLLHLPKGCDFSISSCCSSSSSSCNDNCSYLVKNESVSCCPVPCKKKKCCKKEDSCPKPCEKKESPKKCEKPCEKKKKFKARGKPRRFCVTVVPKAGSPWEHRAPGASVFAINGKPAGVVHLQRGRTYHFDVNQSDIPEGSRHPFALYCDPLGGPAGYASDNSSWTPPIIADTFDPVTNGVACLNVDKTFPKYAFYGCVSHPGMGSLIIVHG